MWKKCFTLFSHFFNIVSLPMTNAVTATSRGKIYSAPVWSQSDTDMSLLLFPILDSLSSIFQSCHPFLRLPWIWRSGLGLWPGWSVLLKAIHHPRLLGRRMEALTFLLPENEGCTWCRMMTSSSLLTWRLKTWGCTAARLKMQLAACRQMLLLLSWVSHPPD